MSERAPSAAKLLDAALEAARAGAEILGGGYGKVMTIARKGPDNPVTKFDLAAERAVQRVLRRRYPSHAILAEEEGDVGAVASSYRWYVDPLDGTVNFTRARPDFCVSVACALIAPPDPPKVLAGVVLAPVLRELWWAKLGGGAGLDQELPNRRIRRKLVIGDQGGQTGALVVAGFPYGYQDDSKVVLESFGRAARAAGAIRQSGSAALDLCAVASGRADAYFELGLKPWDVAAGMLLVAEAGGKVTDWSGRKYALERSRTLLAAASKFHAGMRLALAGKDSVGGVSD